MSKEAISETHESIIQWIKKIKFKKRFIGGVDEADVFKKIEELNDLYEKALLNERARYETLLNEYKRGGAGDE